jgi:hypothetical protein
MSTIIVLLIIMLTLLFTYFLYLFHKRVHDSNHNQSAQQYFTCSNDYRHLYFLHSILFQPYQGNVSHEIAEHRVVTWCKEFYRIAKRHTDSDDKNPIQTFFYHETQYNPRFVDDLSKLVRDSIADIEILSSKKAVPLYPTLRNITEFKDILFHHHGLLRKNDQEKIMFSLATESHTDDNDMTNIADYPYNTEYLIKLLDAGCYSLHNLFGSLAPAAISDRMFYLIHRKNDNTINNVPLSSQHFTDEHILNIPGFQEKKRSRRCWELIGRYENLELGSNNPFHPNRIDSWIKNSFRLDVNRDLHFINIHTWSTKDKSIRYLFGENGLTNCWTNLERYCKKNNFVLHYISSWDLYTILSKICNNSNTKNP